MDEEIAIPKPAKIISHKFSFGSKKLQVIKNNKIHALLYLNKYGETWCYSLSKAIKTGLPILYNNLGAFKERLIPGQIKPPE